MSDRIEAIVGGIATIATRGKDLVRETGKPSVSSPEAQTVTPLTWRETAETLRDFQVTSVEAVENEESEKPYTLQITGKQIDVLPDNQKTGARGARITVSFPNHKTFETATGRVKQFIDDATKLVPELERQEFERNAFIAAGVGMVGGKGQQTRFSRRAFFTGGGTLIGTFAALALACQQTGEKIETSLVTAIATPEGQATVTKVYNTLAAPASPTPNPTITVEVEGSPTTNIEATVTRVPELPPAYGGVPLTTNYLLEEGVKLASNNVEATPDPVVTFPNGVEHNGIHPEGEFLEKVKEYFDLDTVDLANPVHVLSVLTTWAEYVRPLGGLVYFQHHENEQNTRVFQDVALYHGRLNLNEGEGTLPDAFPRNLSLKNESGITIIGRHETNGNIVIAVSDFIDRTQEEPTYGAQPHVRFAVVTPSQLTWLTARMVNVKPYNASVSQESEEAKQIILTGLGGQGEELPLRLNVIDDTVYTALIQQSFAFVDTYANPEGSTTGVSFHPHPEVPAPPAPMLEVLAQGITLEDLDIRIEGVDTANGNPENVIVFATAKNQPEGSVALTARYNQAEQRWTWVAYESISFERPEYGINGAIRMNEPVARQYWKDFWTNFLLNEAQQPYLSKLQEQGWNTTDGASFIASLEEHKNKLPVIPDVGPMFPANMNSGNVQWVNLISNNPQAGKHIDNQELRDRLTTEGILADGFKCAVYNWQTWQNNDAEIRDYVESLEGPRPLVSGSTEVQVIGIGIDQDLRLVITIGSRKEYTHTYLPYSLGANSDLDPFVASAHARTLLKIYEKSHLANPQLQGMTTFSSESELGAQASEITPTNQLFSLNS